jgi:rubrerythrin
MEGPAFRWLLLLAANSRADEGALTTLRAELRERFAVDGVTVDDDRPPRTCPACNQPNQEPTLPQHISAGCPALQ